MPIRGAGVAQDARELHSAVSVRPRRLWTSLLVSLTALLAYNANLRSITTADARWALTDGNSPGAMLVLPDGIPVTSTASFFVRRRTPPDISPSGWSITTA